MKQKKQQSSWYRIHLTRRQLLSLIVGTGGLLFAVGAAWFGPRLLGQSAQDDLSTASAAAVERSAQVQTFTRWLDGTVVENETAARPHPIGIMIENMITVRPQAGLQDAAIVFETLAEGGVTRFLAMFAGPGSNQKEIGPVRSARPYYVEWLSEYDALFGHAGGSPDALRSIEGFGIKDLNGIGSEGKYFWRDRARAAPHNLFTSSELLSRALRDKNLTLQTEGFHAWPYKDDVPAAQRPASQSVRVQFSGPAYGVEYRFDPATNTYLRFNGGQKHADANTGEQIRVKNVIVQILPPIVAVGEKGRLTLNVTGTGKGFVFTDGGANIVTWKKDNRTDRTRFFYDSGKEAQLNRGNTWVEIIPEGNAVEYGA